MTTPSREEAPERVRAVCRDLLVALEGATDRVTYHLYDLDEIAERYKARLKAALERESDHDRLARFFREERPDLGFEGDVEGWSPIESAMHFLRRKNSPTEPVADLANREPSEGDVERLADRIEARMGPVFGSPEYLADPVKLARAEKRRRDSAVSFATMALDECRRNP